MQQSNITRMEAHHVPQVADLERQCFSLPWTEEILQRELENSLSLWLVALDGERVVGYIGSQSVLDEADMMNLAVDPDHRRQGIGEALLGALEQRLAENGIAQLSLEVRPSNMAAVTLYESHGYQVVGRRPRYYSRPVEDALILRKGLNGR